MTAPQATVMNRIFSLCIYRDIFLAGLIIISEFEREYENLTNPTWL